MDSDSEPETRSERAYQAQLYFNLGYRHQMEQRLELAIDFYRKSIAALATAEAHTYLGWAYSFAGRLDDAIEECLLAIAVDPDFGNPYNDIGSYLMKQGKLTEAIEWLEKAKSAPRYHPRHFPYLNLARLYLSLGKFEKASRELAQAQFLYREVVQGPAAGDDAAGGIVN